MISKFKNFKEFQDRRITWNKELRAPVSICNSRRPSDKSLKSIEIYTPVIRSASSAVSKHGGGHFLHCEVKLDNAGNLRRGKTKSMQIRIHQHDQIRFFCQFVNEKLRKPKQSEAD